MHNETAQEWDHVLDSERQLAVLAVAVDSNIWAGFSKILAECDSNGGSVGYRNVCNGYMQGKLASHTIEEVEGGSWWTS